MTGFTVYFLHALGGSGTSFRGVGDRLGDDIRTVTIDLPGFGDAVRVPGYTVAEMADHVLARIAQDAAPRWLIAGHSMGGKVASLVARRAIAGDDPVFGLAGVVLLAGSPPSPEPLPDDKRREMLEWVARGPLDDAAARRFVDDNTARPLPGAADAAAIADVLRTEPAAWRHWLTDGSREDLTGTVGVLDVPAVILAGTEDADLGADAQRALHGVVYPRARLVRLPDTGHFVPQERPDEVAAEITRLCAEIDASSPTVPADWARLLAAPGIEPRVRAALAARAIADDPAYAPRALTPAQLGTLRALADVVVPQGPQSQTEHHGTIDLAARVDRQLAAGGGDGWRPADLPPDVEAARLALDAVADSVARDAPAAVRALIAGELDAPDSRPDSLLDAAGLRAWFDDARVDLVRQWLAHPASLARTGNDAYATRGASALAAGDAPRGFAVLGADLRAPWEPPDLGAPVSEDTR